jgi:hypothetical protein
MSVACDRGHACASHSWRLLQHFGGSVLTDFCTPLPPELPASSVSCSLHAVRIEVWNEVKYGAVSPGLKTHAMKNEPLLSPGGCTMATVLWFRRSVFRHRNTGLKTVSLETIDSLICVGF